MSTKSLAVAGQNVTIIAPLGIRDHLNQKFSIEIPKAARRVKGDPAGPSIKVQALALGVTEAEFKAESLALKGQQQEHFVKSRQVVSLLVSDPSIRTSVKQSFRKRDGACIGATATFRKEVSANQTMANELVTLRALVAKLQGTPAITA